MSTQHYWTVPFGSWVQYPRGINRIGVLAGGPTPPPALTQDSYYDSWDYGHVRAHLVMDADNGVITANDGQSTILVGGAGVLYSENWFSYDYPYYGDLICHVDGNSLKMVYIGGERDIDHVEAFAVDGYVDPSGVFHDTKTTNLYLGNNYNTYWWYQYVGPYSGFKKLYDQWCSNFSSMFADIERDGVERTSYRYPCLLYSGYTRQFYGGLCDVKEPSYSFTPHGAEYDWLELALSFGCPDGRRVRRYLADSYVEAANQLPQASATTLQNMLELGACVNNLVHGNFKSLSDFGDLRSLWLGYRYSYTTTKLDISDYRTVTNRLLSLADVPEVTTHGIVVFDEYRVRTSIKVRGEDILPHDTKSFLDKFNAKLSATTVWDMIPWSFVVDWFFHVGAVLERLENCASSYNVNPVACWSSIERLDGKFYLRFPYEYHGGASVFQDFRCSNKTFIMRIADAICLFSR